MKNKIQNIKAMNNINYKKTILKCATAFSGIGAAEQAIKNLNIHSENEFMIEIDANARKTFLANHSVNNVFSDITKVEPTMLTDIDLFIFGSPCQSFSTQGKRMGMEDTRGTLVFNGLQIIQEKQPKYFIYENVRGMFNHDKGNTFAVIKAAFEELNYKIHYQVLNAKNYGAAQNRERLFIVGIRKDIKQEFSFPQPQPVSNSINNYISSSDDFSNYTYESSNLQSFTPKKDTDIKRVATLPHLKYEADKRIVSTSGISPCLLASGSRTKFYDEINNIYRYLTQEEMQQIQGFSKDFKFPVSKTQARKQIGNSIYVGVLEAILKNLIPQHYFIANNVEEVSSMAHLKVKPHIRKGHIRRVGKKKIWIRPTIIHAKFFLANYETMDISQKIKYRKYFIENDKRKEFLAYKSNNKLAPINYLDNVKTA